jgi:hypothetical protein
LIVDRDVHESQSCTQSSTPRDLIKSSRPGADALSSMAVSSLMGGVLLVESEDDDALDSRDKRSGALTAAFGEVKLDSPDTPNNYSKADVGWHETGSVEPEYAISRESLRGLRARVRRIAAPSNGS